MNKEIILKEFIEKVWNEKRKDLVKNYIKDAYQIHLDPGDNWEGQTLNHETYLERLDFSFDSFPDMNFEITSTIEEEHHVAITWILTGTNLGAIGAFEATHKKIRTNGMTIYFFENDLIKGHSQIFDRMTVMEQLGFV